MKEFSFSDYRQRLNKMVEFDEESFSIRGIQHVGYGFTSSRSSLELNIRLIYSGSNNARGCQSIKINVSVYDAEGYYVAGGSTALRGSEEPCIYFSSELIDAFSKIVVALSGEIPDHLPDPNVVQAITISNGICFNFITEGFARHGIKVISCGSKEVDCSKAYKNKQDVFFEFDQVKIEAGSDRKSILNVLLYGNDGTLDGAESVAFTDSFGRLIKRVIAMEIKISKYTTVRKIKVFLEDQ